MTVSLLKGLGQFCPSSGPAGNPSISRAMATSLVPCPGWSKASTNSKKSAKSTVPLPSRSKRGVGASVGVDELEEVGEVGLAVAVEIGGGPGVVSAPGRSWRDRAVSRSLFATSRRPAGDAPRSTGCRRGTGA